jgi:ribosomal protein S18 acetylase RimI-like enzyme
MGEITVRLLDGDEWREYRSAQLTALRESPEAFTTAHDDEEVLTESDWRSRMRRSRRLLAERDGSPVGLASLQEDADDPRLAQLFGLWVRPSAHGDDGVATALVEAGAEAARADGRSHLAYWVGTENAPALGFASGFGFRPGNRRRPVPDGQNGEQEIMMVFPLGSDRRHRLPT